MSPIFKKGEISMDKEVRCPWCEGKDMTLNDINREPVELVYEYHCRECNEPFQVRIKLIKGE